MSVKGFTNTTTDGLIFSVDAYNRKSYVSGDTVTSDLVNGVNADLINGVGFDNKSWVFDGVNDYISCPYSVLGITELTYSIWVNFDSKPTGTEQYHLGGTWDGLEAGRVISFRYIGGNVVRVTTRSDVSSPLASQITIPELSPNVWYNFVYVYNGTIGDFYLDGELIGNFSGLANPIKSTSTSNKFTIGQDISGFGIFGGKVSNIKIHNKSLSEEQVLQNYNGLKWRFK